MERVDFGRTLDKVLELLDQRPDEPFEYWLARGIIRTQAVLVVMKERIEKEPN